MTEHQPNNAEKDAPYTPLTMEQIEAFVEEVIEANTVWPDPLPSQVSAVMDIVREAMAQAWDQGRVAERRDWEFTFDLSTPDEDRQPWPNPYRPIPPAAICEAVAHTWGRCTLAAGHAGWHRAAFDGGRRWPTRVFPPGSGVRE